MALMLTLTGCLKTPRGDFCDVAFEILDYNGGNGWIALKKESPRTLEDIVSHNRLVKDCE